ncbi:MAG: hypothetical protein QM811_29660 [Pirellulales bacterium]
MPTITTSMSAAVQLAAASAFRAAQDRHIARGHFRRAMPAFADAGPLNNPLFVAAEPGEIGVRYDVFRDVRAGPQDTDSGQTPLGGRTDGDRSLAHAAHRGSRRKKGATEPSSPTLGPSALSRTRGRIVNRSGARNARVSTS